MAVGSAVVAVPLELALGSLLATGLAPLSRSFSDPREEFVVRVGLSVVLFILELDLSFGLLLLLLLLVLGEV